MKRDQTDRTIKEDPTEIADDLLYRTGQALVHDEFDVFKTCFKIPHLLETSEGKRLLTSVDELEGLYQEVRGTMIRKGARDLVRTVVSAEFLEENVIGSTHVAVQIDRDGNKLCPPYPVYSILKRGADDVWLIESSIYAIIDDLEMNMVFHRKHLGTGA